MPQNRPSETAHTSLSRSTFVTGVAALSSVAVPWRAGAQGAKVRMSGFHSDLYQEPFLGQDSGIFTKAGFEVEMVSVTNAAAVVTAIAAGAVDIGVGDLVSGAQAINAGLPVSVIAGSCLYRAADKKLLAGAFVAKDSPLRQPRDLVGKTIGLPILSGFPLVLMQAWLTRNGVSPQNVKLFEIPAATTVAALARGTIDCAYIGEPFVTIVGDQIRSLGDVMESIGSDEYIMNAWFASNSWIAADRDRARRMVAAIYDTARWANAHQDDTLAILVRGGKLDPDRVKGMARARFATTVSPALARPLLNAAVQFKAIDHPVDVSALISRL